MSWHLHSGGCRRFNLSPVMTRALGKLYKPLLLFFRPNQRLCQGYFSLGVEKIAVSSRTPLLSDTMLVTVIESNDDRSKLQTMMKMRITTKVQVMCPTRLIVGHGRSYVEVFSHLYARMRIITSLEGASLAISWFQEHLESALLLSSSHGKGPEYLNKAYNRSQRSTATKICIRRYLTIW